MNGRTWRERAELRSQRAKSGYTALRVTRLTLKKLRELEAKLPGSDTVRGLDELVYELSVRELKRRGKS